MKKQPQKTEQTRRNLMDSFWKLYKKESITKITVGKVCDIANYDRTTFYRYFNDVDDIKNSLEDEILNKIKKNINGNVNNDKKIKITNFNKFSNIYGEYIVTFLNNRNNSFYNKFKKLIKNDCYYYFHFDDIDNNKKELIFEFVFSNLINSYIYWYNHKEIIDLETFVEFSNIIINNGTNIILKNDYNI